jgi:3-oxoacyl-[acyl-carrier-protein] synthase-1
VTPGADIVVVGARTPVGLRAESSAAAIRGGISRRREHPVLIDAIGGPLFCARDAVLPSELRGAERLLVLAKSAAREVIEKLAGRPSLPALVPLFLATPEPRPGLAAAEIERIMRELRDAMYAAGLAVEIHPVGQGHAGALLALELAVKQVMERRSALCIVGGADTYVDPDAVDWLERDRRLSREEVRGGITPGEAAALLVVCSRELRLKLGLPSLGRIRGVATGREARSADSEAGLLGEGLTDVIERATRTLRLPDEAVDDIYCDLNGERHRSDEWGFAVLRAPMIFRAAAGPRYQTAVPAWGDVGAASAALSCLLAVQAWQRGYARGPRALIWGSSDSGLRGAAVLERDGG